MSDRFHIFKSKRPARHRRPFAPATLAFTLTASLGTFALTGVAATFSASMLSSAGAYSVTGLNISYPPLSEAGSFLVTGTNANLVVSYLWNEVAKQSETWTEATKQAETWTRQY